jgi:cardiolipin synthase
MLLDAGVEIHEFQRGLLHAKTMTIDRNLAMIGSANLDRRSFELNLEVSLMVYDQDFASQLRFLQRGYMDASRPVDRAAWNRRPWPTQLVQNAAGTLGPLL